MALALTGCTVHHSSPVGPTATVSSSPATTDPPATRTTYPSNGPDLIAFVTAKYPERPPRRIRRDERIQNMQFLRDRIIEAGKCGGMDLGWNLKRGGAETSIDFIVDQTGGETHGIDIGFDYDNTSQPLRLQWLEGPGPFYQAYPEPSCS